MKAKELKTGDWFHWKKDWRMFRRLAGGVKTIEGKECIPVRLLQPTIMMPGCYIPADDEVTFSGEKLICLN